MRNVTLESIVIYPVKSLGGIALKRSILTPQGLPWDRHWMICDENAKMLTQRQEPKLAAIKTALLGNTDAPCLHLFTEDDPKGVTVNFNTDTQTPLTTHIWKDTTPAIAVSRDASQWLQNTLKRKTPCTLVRSLHTQQRQISAPERFNTPLSHFCDAAPLLLTNTASLNKLNHALYEQQRNPVDMSRFRSNLIISGIDAFEEHRCSHITRGQNILSLVDACSRCVMITVDQNTGQIPAKGDPFYTLSQLNPMADQPKMAAFGINCVLSKGSHATIEVGDTWEIY